MNGKLAVLIPALEGGSLLQRTVASCANAGLHPDRYSIIVVDNDSIDGGLEGLRSDVAVFRNQSNLGRVGNWNRALEIAEAQGFSYAAFLFVGDEWISSQAVGGLLDLMDANGSSLGMGAIEIVNERNELLRTGARVTIHGRNAQVESRRLLTLCVNSGRLPFAPIQANIYRLFQDNPLRFNMDNEGALNCDIEATIRFLQNHPGVVSIASEPFLAWKDRPGRFFTKQDPWTVFIESRRTLKRAAVSTGVQVNWRNANVVAMLSAIRETSRSIPLHRRLAFQFRTLRYLLNDSSGVSGFKMLAFIVRKLLWGQTYLDLSSESFPSRGTAGSFHAVVD